MWQHCHGHNLIQNKYICNISLQYAFLPLEFFLEESKSVAILLIIPFPGMLLGKEMQAGLLSGI